MTPGPTKASALPRLIGRAGRLARFRLLSTGQSYHVEDYGWALSGRNTIDLYIANQHEMNPWGAREETIEVLQWGDPQESLQFLGSHQNYRHIKRMVLGNKEAAALR